MRGDRHAEGREIRSVHLNADSNACNAAILLIGGRKTGGARWYERYVPQAEKIYEQHSKNLENEQTLSVKQAAVSKLEKRTDMYVSTLRNFIKAMGGDLEIVARFPDGSVQISQFEDIASKTERDGLPSSG